MYLLRYIIFILFVLPKFVAWPLLILYRLYLKKRGIENDFITRAIKYAKCLFMQKFKGRGSLELIEQTMDAEYGKIEKKILDLLSREHFKSTVQLTEEFRAEHPRDWEYILNKGRETFGESCTMILSPIIFLSQLLEELARKNQVMKETEQREAKWKRAVV